MIKYIIKQLGRSTNVSNNQHNYLKTVYKYIKRIKKQRKYHEALALSCIAISACANYKYPKEKLDSKKFIAFIKSNFSTYCSIGFPGIQASLIMIYDEFSNKHISYEEMIYKKIRCSLIHEADIPNIIFSKETEIGNYNKNTKLPISIIDMLNKMASDYLKDI
ncbi:hypothetical protein QQG09_04180 [Melissococcus plutonius]|nr:hypothetical protein [Melissococcus plutonius]MBB5178571.1 hypothetical protein [Melissococcus plutonius]MCV2499501.1 hypothetical protein [Melissococcus plutonius]MCV2501128.1 hypothetical protein [Melissococcus plutonius]MCV2508014.1 hypothetical protein [Melissococcus plutonius]MCV2520474.1 hypothetical protein [Melissococcus plutonius]